MICKRCEQWIPWNSRAENRHVVGDYCRHCLVASIMKKRYGGE